MTDYSTFTDRFWKKVERRSSTDCWEWRGAMKNTGYGCISVPGNARKQITAHRASALIHFGMFDRRLMVLHSCDNRRCVNPEHLRLGTNTDNVRDMWDRNRQAGQFAPTDACKRGHVWTDETAGRQRTGRYCKVCRAAWKRARRQEVAS